MCQVVIFAKELTTASVVRQSTGENCDLSTIVEQDSVPPTCPILLHTLAPLDFSREHDTSFEDIVLVEDASDEEEAKISMSVTIEDLIDIIIPLNGSSQSIDETKVEQPKLPSNPSMEEPPQLDMDM